MIEEESTVIARSYLDSKASSLWSEHSNPLNSPLDWKPQSYLGTTQTTTNSKLSLGTTITTTQLASKFQPIHKKYLLKQGSHSSFLEPLEVQQPLLQSLLLLLYLRANAN